MNDIDRIPCHDLNHALSDNVLALHEVCRHYFPMNLKFNFGPRNVLEGEQLSLLANIIQARADVHTTDLPNIKEKKQTVKCKARSTFQESLS